MQDVNVFYRWIQNSIFSFMSMGYLQILIISYAQKKFKMLQTRTKSHTIAT